MSARKWLRFAQDDMVIVYKENVVTISELDKYGVSAYQKYCILAKVKSPVRRGCDPLNILVILVQSKTNTYLEDLYNKGL